MTSMKTKLVRAGVVVGAAALTMTTFAGCATRYATPTSDTYICVFDGSQRGGQKLKFQLPPGSQPKKIDSNDVVVRIPASNRFYMVTTDRSIADPGTPSMYLGNAQGGTPTQVEGQVRFRFNLDRACEWFSVHGRRNAGSNGDLGFNARGNPADVAQLGWFKFLNENFGVTMQEVVSERIGSYNWQNLHFNFPINADINGIVPKDQKPGDPTRIVLGNDLGKVFTDRLNQSLGTEVGKPGFFCGVNSTTTCEPLEFQVRYAGPGFDSQLVKDRAAVEDQKNKLDAQNLQNQIQASQQGQQITAENAKTALLNKQAENAELQAKIDTAKCRTLAAVGDDCDGKRVAGGTVTVNQGK